MLSGALPDRHARFRATDSGPFLKLLAWVVWQLHMVFWRLWHELTCELCGRACAALTWPSFLRHVMPLVRLGMPVFFCCFASAGLRRSTAARSSQETTARYTPILLVLPSTAIVPWTQEGGFVLLLHILTVCWELQLASFWRPVFQFMLQLDPTWCGE